MTNKALPPILQRRIRLQPTALLLAENDLRAGSAMPGATLARGFVDIDQGCCILEQASVTTCPDIASKRGGHMSPPKFYPPLE